MKTAYDKSNSIEAVKLSRLSHKEYKAVYLPLKAFQTVRSKHKPFATIFLNVSRLLRLLLKW